MLLQLFIEIHALKTTMRFKPFQRQGVDIFVLLLRHRHETVGEYTIITRLRTFFYIEQATDPVILRQRVFHGVKRVKNAVVQCV